MRLPDLLATKSGRMAAFFLLYMTEGIPLGFTATAIVTQMRRRGLGPAQTGIFVGMLYLPWAWKWLVGPVVDVLHSRRLGRRRGWILAMHGLMCLGLLALMPINFVNQLGLFTAIVVLINLFSATQDVAIDALACGVLSEAERGLANGMMFAGAYVGQAVGGSVVLYLTEHVPFNATFAYVIGAILSVTVFVVLPMREPESDSGRGSLRDVTGRIREYAGDALKAFFGTRAAVAGLAFALLPIGAYALSLALQSNLAVELGFTNSGIASLTLVSTIISAGGCVVGGWLSDRFGRRMMLAMYIACTAIPTIYLAWIMQRHGWVLPRDAKAAAAAPAALITAFWVANIVFALFQGLLYGTRTALFMDICTPKVAATQFTAYMALMNVVIWYSANWQGYVAERWGYPTALLIDGLGGVLCVAVLPLMRKPTAAVTEAAVPAELDYSSQAS